MYKTRRKMNGWKKVWNVTEKVLSFSIPILLSELGRGLSNSSRGSGPTSGSSGGGSVWTVGHGGKKGYGSWSSFRHS